MRFLILLEDIISKSYKVSIQTNLLNDFQIIFFQISKI